MGEITCYAVDDVKTDENGDLLEKRPKPIYEFSKNSSQMRIIKIVIGCFLLAMLLLIIVNVLRGKLFSPSKNIAKVAPTSAIKGGFRRR
jgi:hypothetical protein